MHDTLDSIVSPALRDTLLAEALSAAALNTLPTEPGAYLDFLDGPLRQALERALGRELGRSVREELERLSDILISEDLSSGARLAAARALGPRSAPGLEGGSGPDRRPTRSDMPSPESRRATLPAGKTPSRAPLSVDPQIPAETATRAGHSPTVPAPPEIRWSEPRPPASGDFPSGVADALGMQIDSTQPQTSRRLPMVFVATRDPELVRRFSAWLDPHAVVVRVARLMDLLLDLEDIGQRRTVIVYDARRAPWRPEALAALAEELPDETRVLLWGASRDTQLELSRISTRVTRWTACPEATPLADVVERCVALVG